MADIELVIKIPEELYASAKNGTLNEIQSMYICGSVVEGIPINTVTNAEEAEAYPINQEENCNIVCDFIRDITGIDIRKGE